MISIKAKHFWTGIAVALYLFISLIHLGLPGLEYDELLFVNGALGNVDGSFVSWQFHLLGRKIPLMLMGYIGALKALLYTPIFALFGMNPTAVRLPVVLAGLITLLVTYLLVQRIFGRWVAVSASLLLATDPTFIFANKLDWGPVSLMLLLEVSSLYFLWRWLAGGEPHFLVIAGFLLGLGLYNKVIFIWFIAALLVSLLLCFQEQVRGLLTAGRMFPAVGAFMLGCLPLIAFNIARPMGTFAHQKVVTRDWSASLKHRFLLFRATMDGSGIYYVVNHASVGEVAGLGEVRPENKLDLLISGLGTLPIKATLMPYAFVLALALILLLYLLKQLDQIREPLFFFLQFVLIAIFICLSAGASGPHHTIAVYPIPHVLVGFALSLLRQGARFGGARLPAGGLIATVCVSILTLANLTIDARYVRSFIVKGGFGAWSDAIYQLAAFTKQHPGKSFLLMDWGFNAQLLLLSEGRINKEEAPVQFRDFSGEEKIARMKPFLKGGNTLLVFHAPPFETYSTLKFFRSALDRYGLEGRPVKTFYQRDGRPIYVVWEILGPEVETRLSEKRFFYLREAEDFDALSGGGQDLKQGASRNEALGNFWGKKLSDFVVYRFSVPRKTANVRLYLRYAFSGQDPQQYNLFLDGDFIDSFGLPPSRGFGYSADEWKLSTIKLGWLGPGNHELKLAPGVEEQVVNLDYFYLSEGELWIDTKSPVRPTQSR